MRLLPGLTNPSLVHPTQTAQSGALVVPVEIRTSNFSLELATSRRPTATSQDSRVSKTTPPTGHLERVDVAFLHKQDSTHRVLAPTTYPTAELKARGTQWVLSWTARELSESSYQKIEASLVQELTTPISRRQ